MNLIALFVQISSNKERITGCIDHMERHIEFILHVLINETRFPFIVLRRPKYNKILLILDRGLTEHLVF